MAKSSSGSYNSGITVTTNELLDPQSIEQLNVSSEEFKEFLIKMRNVIGNIALTLNYKDTGLYTLEEYICSQLYFSDPSIGSTSTNQPSTINKRDVFRKVINFGALPNTAAKTVAHDITINATATATLFSLTRLYGAATDPTLGAVKSIPLPYASPTAANCIELSIDKDNVIITTGSNRTAFTKCYVVIEYIQE